MKRLTAWVVGAAAVFTLSPLCLNYFTPPDASPEWLYTLEWLNLVLVLAPLPCAAIFLAATGNLPSFRFGKSRKSALAFLVLSFVVFAIPCFAPDARFLNWRFQYLLSGCWLAGLLASGIFLFLLGARVNATAAACLCLAGSVFLGLAAMEGTFLFSTQAADGLREASANSLWAGTTAGVAEYENWTPTECGWRPAAAGGALPSFHRHDAFDKSLFDVVYTFNDQGWRRLPESSPNAENDLLLFGCSFTFGFGLNDRETWAWQLAEQLGPDWQVKNYSANGYSANHVLCLLEHGLIAPPQGRYRYALFLALDQHLRRNDFFLNTPHYHLTGAQEAQAGGNPRHTWVSGLPRTFNGSQLAREASAFITGLILKKSEEPLELYLAMLKKSAEILWSEYKTRLIILVWPGLEEIAPRLEAMGLTALLAQPMLHLWDDPVEPGWKYRIDRERDPHPNRLAASELAAGLAHYFLGLQNGNAL